MVTTTTTTTDKNTFNTLLLTLYLIAPPTYIFLRFLQAPYGKHNRPGWGPTIPPPLAWFLMESPTLWLTLAIFLSTVQPPHKINPKAWLLISPFLIHYIHRTCIYPLQLRLNTAAHHRKTKPSSGFPVAVALMAFGYNLLNSYLQASWVFRYMDYDAISDGLFWFRFFVGLLVFGFGMYVNIWADRALVALKKQSAGGGYQVPRGGWFDLVSCPNYFGEIVEWLGWSIMTWSWVGLGFLLYTCANLVPRARANHVWYLDKFGEDYPKNRKAVFPYLY